MRDCVLPSYEVLTSEQIDRINDNSYLVKYHKGQTICHQGHPISHIFFLKSGLIKVYGQYQKDKNAILGIIGPNSFFSMMSIFTSKEFQTSASALEDSEVFLTKLDIFLDIIDENGKYAHSLLKQVSQTGLRLAEKMAATSFKHITGKLADLLLILSKDFYAKKEFEIPLSRQEIADFILATKETVSRTLGEFKNDRLIDMNGKFITLKSIDLLEKLSKLG